MVPKKVPGIFRTSPRRFKVKMDHRIFNIQNHWSLVLHFWPPIEIWGVDNQTNEGQRTQNIPPQHVSNIFERYGDGSISGGPYPAIPTMLVWPIGHKKGPCSRTARLLDYLCDHLAMFIAPSLTSPLRRMESKRWWKKWISSLPTS